MNCRDDMLTHGVYIVTAAYDGTPRGMTAAWACQVGIDGIMVFIGDQSSTREYILRSRGFGMSVLAEGQTALAKRFGTASSLNMDKFEGVRFHFGETGSPLLDDCPLTLDCKVDDVFNYGEGKLIIGKIISVEDQVDDYSPLLYRSEDY